MNPIKNITSIDGRYNKQTQELQNYFSEYALIKYRIHVEIEYLIYLEKYNLFNYKFRPNDIEFLLNIYKKFTIYEAEKVKSIENTINHDVKAVEYFIKQKINANIYLNNKNISTFVHFGLTSQDINSSAYILSIKNSINDVMLPNLYLIFNKLLNCSKEWNDISILSKTHGQPATPSLLGKEFLVFIERLNNQIDYLKDIKYKTKFGGAIGNLNSLVFSKPHINWLEFADGFIRSLDLVRNQFTTQIDHYDNYSVIFDNVKRINNILIDLCQDIWMYISLNYFSLKINKEEVGSSTMPHKVNPINFENAEGNLLLANTILEFLANKLPKSRLQRDLTDSTILRNIGVAFGYSLIAYKSLLKGLNKLEVNVTKINEDLEGNYIVVAEGIQTKLKLLGIEDSYEKIKEITRIQGTNTELMKQKLKDYVQSLNISVEDKNQILKITPFNYTGVVPIHSFTLI